MPSQQRFLLALILVAALAFRLTWSARQSPDPDSLHLLPDQLEYLHLGQNLLDGRGLQFVDPRFNARVWAYRTPGYPAFVALCGANLTAIRVAQSVLDTSTVLAVFLLAGVWLSPRGALLAAALAALNPLLIYFSSLVLSETLFVAMLLWGMVLLTRRGAAPLVGGAILALAVLVRPSAIFLPVLLPLAAVRKRSFLLAGGCALMTLAALFPWALRNHEKLGEWVWTTTNAGITKYDGLNPAATGGSDQSFVMRMPELSRMSEVDRSRYLSNRAEEFVRDNPLACLRLAALKIARLWSPIPLSDEFRRPIYVAVGLVYSLPLFLAALAGLFFCSLPPRAMCLLWMTPLYLTLIHAASVSSLRYRLPAEPMLVIVAASAALPRKSDRA